MITTLKYCDLADHIKSELETRVLSEFGHIPIVADTQWATPDWTVISYVGDNIACFYNIVLRKVTFDDTIFLVGGVNNVITSPEYRGRGLASRILSETEPFIFERLMCQFGLLLCSDELIPFYERLQWYRVNCPVHFQQLDGTHVWNANAMLRHKRDVLTPETIDLNGLPW